METAQVKGAGRSTTIRPCLSGGHEANPVWQAHEIRMQKSAPGKGFGECCHASCQGGKGRNNLHDPTPSLYSWLIIAHVSEQHQTLESSEPCDHTPFWISLCSGPFKNEDISDKSSAKIQPYLPAPYCVPLQALRVLEEHSSHKFGPYCKHVF